MQVSGKNVQYLLFHPILSRLIEHLSSRAVTSDVAGNETVGLARRPSEAMVTYVCMFCFDSDWEPRPTYIVIAFMELLPLVGKILMLPN